MGNKLSCSCTPLIKKAYKYEDTPFKPRREGRLWAEVFHVPLGPGAIRWQQVSDDLVPVNIKCIQDQPDFTFKITAYNSHVEKILDVTLRQPGTRIGQASDCFVYWKDPSSGETWGLNFTSPLDARQFKELCSPSFKAMSRKASSSYSLRLNDGPPPYKRTGRGDGQSGQKRKPQSTPSSPRRAGYASQSAGPQEELQCTCMTAEALHRQRNGRVRYTASATLPKSFRQDSAGSQSSHMSGYPSQTSVAVPQGVQRGQQPSDRGQRIGPSRQPQQPQSRNVPSAQYSRAQYAQSSRRSGQSRSFDSTSYHHHQQQQQQPQQYHQQQPHQRQPMAQVASGQRMSSSQQRQQQQQHHYPQQGQYLQHQAPQQHHPQGPRSKSSDDVRRQQNMATGTDDLRPDGHQTKRIPYPLSKASSIGQESTASRDSRRVTATRGGQGTCRPTSVPWSCYPSSVGISGPTTEHYYRMSATAASTAPTAHNNVAQLSQATSLQPASTSSQSKVVDPRSRLSRSEVGRRRSLERMQCFDYADLSPTTELLPPPPNTSSSDPNQPTHLPSTTTSSHRPHAIPPHVLSRGITTPTPSSSGDETAFHQKGQQHQHQQHPVRSRSAAPPATEREHHVQATSQQLQANRSASPTIKVLQEYEQHLRNALAKGNDADTYSLNTFETILSQSMENVVALMKEVQSEIEAIRREESHYRSTADEAIFTHRSGRPQWARSYTLPSRGTSLPPPGLLGSSTGDLYNAIRKTSVPILDSLSVDGGHYLRPQSSFESTASDSRAYLTSSEMSDDERLSLTTAISDEDDGETRDSPYRAKSGAAAAAFQCTGAVRKAGFLSVKKWLLRKRHQIELARKRGWKGYWVCLKGTTLLFYPCDSRDGRAIENTPRHLIIIDGAIMQPIPEHPKRDFIFCLSTAFGDAYLFQAPCQVELDNWIGAIHNACGAAFARHRGKNGALHLLSDEISRLDRQIEVDAKLKHMAELQLSVVADADSRRALNEQIRAHEESLEQNHCEQFRLRCYIASVQITELPNPKTLLAHVSKSTKMVLNRLGVFTVSSFHAYICARSPSMLTNVISGRSNNSRRRSTSSVRSSRGSSVAGRSRTSDTGSGDKLIRLIIPPDDTIHAVYVRGTETVEELLWMVMAERQLSPIDYYIRLKKPTSDYYVPARHETIDSFPPYDVLEVLPKILYQVELIRTTPTDLFGFSVEAELVENAIDHHNQDELCVYVSRVEDLSLASSQGLVKGDEIMVINGAIVSDLDMMYIESVLQEELSLCMMLRSCRTEAPEKAAQVKSTDEYIESLVCPPPPTDGALSEEMLAKLTVPSPHWATTTSATDHHHHQSRPSSRLARHHLGSGDKIAETLLKTAEEVTSEYCRLPSNAAQSHRAVPIQDGHHHQFGAIGPGHLLHTTQLQIHPSCTSPLFIQHSTTGAAGPQASLMSTSPTPPFARTVAKVPLTDAEKLRKVIKELVDTEATYVENLNNLLEIYLEPMKKQELLSEVDISALFGNIQEIVSFQRVYLETLEESVSKEGKDFENFEQISQFRGVLMSLGDAFLTHADKFKLYSSFCASHSKAQKILHPSSEHLNPELIEFLNSRSRGQQAYSLESFLIKPIQRILKYPLLLQQLKSLTDPGSDEHKHLAQALSRMERVAEHINEMQRIHEEYGAIFDHLQRQHFKSNKSMVDLSPVDLLYYGGVDWVNIVDFLGKIKKGLDLHAMTFIFKTAVVFLCKERIRQKKKLVGVTSKLPEVEIIRYQVLIPVTEVQVRSVGGGRDSACSDGRDSQMSEFNPPIPQLPRESSIDRPVHQDTDSGNAPSTPQFMWELIHLRCQTMPGGSQRRTEKVYQLSNSTNEFRNAFLRTIRQIIRESVRKMALPATKPSIFQTKSLPHSISGPSPSSTQTLPSRGDKHKTDPGPSTSGTQDVSSLTKPKQKPPPPPRAPTTTVSGLKSPPDPTFPPPPSPLPSAQSEADQPPPPPKKDPKSPPGKAPPPPPHAAKDDKESKDSKKDKKKESPSKGAKPKRKGLLKLRSMPDKVESFDED